jgi:hypothetical protein
MMCAMRKLALFPLLMVVACNDSRPAPASAPQAEAPAAQPAPGAPPSQAPSAPPSQAATEAPAEAPGPEPAAAAEVEPALGEVELELGGALTGTLRGAGAACSRFEIEGTSSATIKVMSRDLGAEQDWDLTLMVTTEEEWETPAVILNVRGATRASYTYARKEPAGESVSVARDLTGATIDLTLKELVGKRTVKVKGTIRCPA